MGADRTLSARRALREIAVIVFFVLASAAMTWPLVANLRSAIADPGDPFFSTWAMDWDYHATFTRASLFNANIFHPSRLALAFSEHMFGIALFMFPLRAAGVAPLTAHNIAVLAGFASCGYFMFLLGRYATRCTAAGIIGGLCYAFIGFRFHHLPHVHFIWSAWLPVLLLTLLAYSHKPTLLRALAFAIAFFLNGTTSLHWFLFGAVASGLTAFLFGMLFHRRSIRYWVVIACAAALALVALWPFIQPYRTVAKDYGMQRTFKEAFPTSAEWRDWLQPGYQNRLYGRWSTLEAYGHERALFPGVMVTLLAIVGLSRYRTMPAVTTAAILWIVIGAIGARGVRGFLYELLFSHVSAFRGIRMPARWAMVAYVGLALLAAIGASRLLERDSRPARAIIAVALGAAVLFELRVAPIRWFLVPADPRPLYTWLRDVPIRGAIVELPMTQDAAYEYLWRATAHHRPLINGVSSYVPRPYAELLQLYESAPIPDDLFARLEERNCSLIVVHQRTLGERSTAVREWLWRGLDTGRLQFVRRFEDGVRADYVFALARNEPAASQWREPEIADPSGLTPAMNLEAFLEEDSRTYSTEPDVSVDRGPLGTFRGPMTVSGWTVAAEGVAEVRLRMGNGRSVVVADRHERPDVMAVMPWYPAMKLAGFSKTFDRPPNGIEGDTDLQIEVVTTRGRTRRWAPFWFEWYGPMQSVPAWKDAELAALVKRLAPPDPHAYEKLLAGNAAISDYTDGLITHVEDETNEAFLRRVTQVLFGEGRHAIEASQIRALAEGTPRERVVRAMLQSPEFAQQHLRRGTIDLP